MLDQEFKNIKPKHTIRLLKRFAKENCEPTNYSYLEKYSYPEWNEEKGYYERGIIAERPVNHLRRVKRVFKKWGINAAIAYLTVNKKKINK